MNSSCLKVTVNGKKFLITGIRKEVLRKDLLCALAKTSDETFQQLKHGGYVAKQHECVSDELSKSTSDENLLSLLKGDRETAGDYESLKILNSLGKNARIIKRCSENRGQIKDLPPRSHKGTSKERKHTRSKKKYTRELSAEKSHEKKPEKCTRSSSSSKRVSANCEISPRYTRPKYKQTVVQRSVDDSDIDSYKQPKLNKLRKRQKRCYDDSDIDIYNSLYNIVRDQNVKLHNTRAESKQFIKRTSWLEENLKVYYIDDVNSHNNNNINNTATTIATTNTNDDNNSNIISSNYSTTDDQAMNTSASIIYEDNDDVDIDNDSGLPSPEYDSSESTENQPIRLQRTMTRLQNKAESDNISEDQDINTVLRNAYIKNKQVRDVNENITLQHNNKERTDNADAANTSNERVCITEDNTGDDSTDVKSSNSSCSVKPGKLANYNEDVYLQRRSKSLGDLLLNSRGESTPQTASLHSESEVFSYNITNGLGLTDEIDEEKVRYILKNLTNDKIINMGVLNPAFLGSTLKSKRKLEKKKINKADISEPQLLSPTQFRRYGSLKNVQQAAMLLKNGINLGSFGRSAALPTGEKADERKDKEKFYNKKLLEVRRSKRSSKSSSKSDTSTSHATKAKEKDKTVPTDKPPGEKSKSRSEKKHSKERDKHKSHETHDRITKDKKESKSHKHRDELKLNTRHFKREKSFDSTTPTTTPTDQNDDTRSLCSSVGRCSSTEPDTRHRKELDINDIEKQIIELNKLKCQQKSKECSSEKYICQNVPSDNSSILDDRNMMVASDSNDENEFHLINDHRDDDDDDDDGSHKHDDKCVNDDILETTSDYSSLNENIKLEGIDDVDVDDIERTELMALYTKEEAAVNDLIEKILDYNLLIEALSEELDILKAENDSNETMDDLIAEEENIYVEIDSVRGLLQSVIDLCAYQRKEMSENLALLDKLDTKVRTKKAGYEILRSGEWRTNSKSAPRSLLKYSKEKKAANVHASSNSQNSSVV